MGRHTITAIGLWRSVAVPAAVAILWASLAGCEVRDDDAIVVATTWTSAECGRIRDELREWLAGPSTSPSAPKRPFRISWVWLSGGDNLELFAKRRGGVDVLLGGPVETYENLAIAGLLEPADAPADTIPWLSIETGSETVKPSESREPRLDGRFLRTAERELNDGPWAKGYERLIRMTEPGQSRQESRSGPALEGSAVLAASRRSERAKSFRMFLIERRGAKPAGNRRKDEGASEGLLADLLAATMIDSRDELLDAWSALKNAPDAAQSLRWMCEPPPWPPASVEKIHTNKGDQAMTMLETLAGQISPDPRLREWLLRSWLAPRRAIDGNWLRELAKAVNGELVREPRFRSWLRAEWTAWARQRYRRVARQARAGLPVRDAQPVSVPAPELRVDGAASS